jgi:hypothetical protein
MIVLQTDPGVPMRWRCSVRDDKRMIRAVVGTTHRGGAAVMG